MITQRKFLPYLVFFVAALVLAGGSYAYHLDNYQGSLEKITGEITEIDTNHSTISMKSGDGSTVAGIAVTEATWFGSCGRGAYSNDLSKVVIGEAVTVTLYRVDGRIFADIISPADEKC